MTDGLPDGASAVLEGGALCYLAVRTSAGPHVTPAVYALESGRLWLTTSRRSVKARAWQRDESVSGLVSTADAGVIFRGRIRSYDALDPLSWPIGAGSALRVARAAARFSAKNVRFFAGYARDAGRVPLSWSPPARVFAAVEPVAGKLLRGDHVTAGWGRWATGAAFSASFDPLPRRKGLDLKVPRPVSEGVGTSGFGALALESGEALTVLPVRWRRVGAEGTYDAVLPTDVLKLAAVSGRARAALVVDRASAWRAAEMIGMLLQCEAEFFMPSATTGGRDQLRRRISRSWPEARRFDDADRSLALVRLLPQRIVWWEGWASGTVALVRRGGR